MQGDYQGALDPRAGDYGFATGLSLATPGRRGETISVLRDSEASRPAQFSSLYLVSLRLLLEGKHEESLRASNELMNASFRDPEGMYYLARQLGYLGEHASALDVLRRAVEHGFYCYAAMVRDPWLDGLRGKTEFSNILHEAHQLHLEAHQAFVSGGGDELLGVRTEES